MQMILSFMLLLSSFPNVYGENTYSWASCHARQLAQQVALVCGGLKENKFQVILKFNTEDMDKIIDHKFSNPNFLFLIVCLINLYTIYNF
jgi:hypothetical protein